MKKNVTKEYLSIPNLLGYFPGSCSFPFICMFYVNASSERDYHLAVLSFSLSFSIRFSGWKDCLTVLIWLQISERYWTPSQTRSHRGAGTEFYIPLSCRCRIAGRFLIKGEAVMGVLGLYLIRRGVPTEGAKMHGKICTALLDAAMLVCSCSMIFRLTFVSLLILVCILP